MNTYNKVILIFSPKNLGLTGFLMSENEALSRNIKNFSIMVFKH